MTAEITATNMIPPPPCGHMNGTHPYDCWWPTVGDVVYAEIARLRKIEAAARVLVDGPHIAVGPSVRRLFVALRAALGTEP